MKQNNLKKYFSIFLLFAVTYSGCSKSQKNKAGRIICTSLGTATGAAIGSSFGLMSGAGMGAINLCPPSCITETLPKQIAQL